MGRVRNLVDRLRFGRTVSLPADPPPALRAQSLQDLEAMMDPQQVRAAKLTGVKLSQLISNYYAQQYDGSSQRWTDWTTENAVQDGMKISSSVFACVHRMAKAVASVPWVAVKGDGEEREIVGKHPISDLINNPNPFWSRQDLLERVTMHLLLAGNAIVPVNELAGKPRELWAVSPDACTPIKGTAGKFITNYAFFDENGTPVRKEPVDRIIHMQVANPADPYWGLPPLQAAGRAVDTDVAQAKWNYNATQNGNAPFGAWVSKTYLTDDQYEELLERVAEEYAGPVNARKPLVLGADLEWKDLARTSIDLDYLNSRKLNREEICSVLGVPPPMIGIYDQATLANLEGSRRVFWEEGVIPFLIDIRDSFNRVLAPKFGSEVRLDFDLRFVPAMQAMYKDRSEIAWRLWQMGYPANVLNRRLQLGLPSIEGGDKGYLPGNMMPSELLGQDTSQVDNTNPAKGKASGGDNLPTTGQNRGLNGFDFGDFEARLERINRLTAH